MRRARLPEDSRILDSSAVICITQRGRLTGSTASKRGSEVVAQLAMLMHRLAAPCRSGRMRSTRQAARRGPTSSHDQIGRCSGVKASPSSVFTKMGTSLRGAAISLGLRH